MKKWGCLVTLLLCFNFYLVIDGSIELSSCIPGQEEFIADWIIDTDTWVWLSSNEDTKSKKNGDQVKIITILKILVARGCLFVCACVHLKSTLSTVCSCPGLFPDLKHSFRRARVRGPAWYSSPPMMDGTRSSSSTNTAISLSRLPSMLRSLMLAEPETHMAHISHHLGISCQTKNHNMKYWRDKVCQYTKYIEITLCFLLFPVLCAISISFLNMMM